jgi:hypothetical protein
LPELKALALAAADGAEGKRSDGVDLFPPEAIAQHSSTRVIRASSGVCLDSSGACECAKVLCHRELGSIFDLLLFGFFNAITPNQRTGEAYASEAQVRKPCLGQGTAPRSV